MPVREREDKEKGVEVSASSSSGSSSNDSSSSGSDSSSNSDSSSDDSSSSSDDDSGSSASSSAPAPPTSSSNNKGPPPPPKDGKKTKGGVAGRSRSRSSTRSRAASLSSISSASSTRSRASKRSLSTKKPTSTTSGNNGPVIATKSAPKKPEGDKGNANKNKKVVATPTSSSGPTKKEDKWKQQGGGNKGGTNNTKALPVANKGARRKSEEEKKQTPPTNTKSKVIKSGTVTNTKTIKPLLSKVSSKKITQTKKPVNNKDKDMGTKKSLNMSGINKKNVPPGKVLPTAGPSKGKKEALQKKPVAPAPVKKEKTISPPKVTEGRVTRSSSCSSTVSGSSSSSSDNSSSSDDEGPGNSSQNDSSPVKPTKKVLTTGTKSSPSPKKPTPTKALTVKKEPSLKKKGIVRKLSNELISSADDDTDADQGSTKKKKEGQRRPITRRQKSGAKKTIPTTTVFNQSLLLAATNSSGSPNGSPRKPTVVAASSSSDLHFNHLSSSIINRRSTSNSSLSSSESESVERGRKKLPYPTVESGTRNKYLSTWDSDFSDDNFSAHINHSAANFIRVPAKTSNRPRDIINQGLDPEAIEIPRCPFPSCDSGGHLSGKYPSHSFLNCCPTYHGFEPEECIENDRERSRREGERKRFRNILSTPGKKPPKQTSETKNWLSSMKQLKEVQTENGLVSQYDLQLWKDALALSAERIEKEQSEGVTSQGIYARLSMAVAMGRFEMKCWCASPYPEPLNQNRRLFVCEFCLKPVASSTILRRHCAKCVWRHPPGDEIYRKDRLSVWEVDGKKQKTYCQYLCLLAKCFLDHKTLYLDVDPFLFYVMTLADSQGCHLVGYFSKEKNSFLNYNVSCILTLPPYMRQGFGRLLIDFSYLLTRVEGKVGSPEKPLSDLGLISYRSYWKDAVLRRMCACASREINIKDLSIELGVSSADLVSTLQFLGMLKYWKGKHLVLKKQDVLEEYLERVRRRGNERQIDSSCLRWRPYQVEEHSSSEKA